MRGLELHYHAKPIQRSAGKSAVAAAAYRSGTELHDKRTGIDHDYTAKSGIEHNQIFTPENAPDWTQDRNELWNQVEAKENRKNSNLAYDFTVGFPAEMDHDTRIEMGSAIAQEFVNRYDTAVDIAWHEPGKEGDDRNYHAHIMMTTRGFDDTTDDGWASKKLRDLSKDTKDSDGNFYLDEEGNKSNRGAEEIKSLRQFAADKMNEISERDELGVHVEHESLKKRSIEREPQKHVGVQAMSMHRQGMQSDRFDENEEIKERNKLLELAGRAREYVSEKFNNALAWIRREENQMSQTQQEEQNTAYAMNQSQRIAPGIEREEEKGMEFN